MTPDELLHLTAKNVVEKDMISGIAEPRIISYNRTTQTQGTCFSCVY